MVLLLITKGLLSLEKMEMLFPEINTITKVPAYELSYIGSGVSSIMNNGYQYN